MRLAALAPFAAGHDEGPNRHALRSEDDDLDRAVAVPECTTLGVRRMALARHATRRRVDIEDTEHASGLRLTNPQCGLAASARPLPRIDPDRSGLAHDFDLAPSQVDVDAIDRSRRMGR